MGVNSGIYKFLVFLHIFCAIVGFGAVYLNSLYGAQARARRGPEGLAIAEANFKVSKIATYFIYGVFVTGVLVVLTSDEAWGFGDAFITWAMLLYLVGIAVSHGVMMPSAKRMQALVREVIAAGPPVGGPPPQAAEMESVGKRLAIGGAFLDVLLVVILLLMVWKPL